jgi:hypothetical protein
MLLVSHGGQLLDRSLLVVGQQDVTLLSGRGWDLPDGLLFGHALSFQSDLFEVLLVGRTGRMKERWSEALNPDGLCAIIDAMPMRIDEMRRN